MEKLLYKASEAAKILSISVKTLDRRIEAGELTPIYKEGHRYFTFKQLEEYVSKIETASKKQSKESKK